MRFLIVFILLMLSSSNAYAAEMNNSSYILNLSNDIYTPKPTPTSAKEKLPVLARNPKLITGDNYLAYVSYDFDIENSPFVFTNSSTQINFGKILPGEPLIRTQSLTALPGSNYAYKILAYENHSPQKETFSIPDTSCDTGDCTQFISSIWQNPLTYGFGYRCDSVDNNTCSAGFSEEGYFKRFANESAQEIPAEIVSSSSGEKSEAVISYKLNIAGNQEEKGYENFIYLIAVPSL